MNKSIIYNDDNEYNPPSNTTNTSITHNRSFEQHKLNESYNSKNSKNSYHYGGNKENHMSSVNLTEKENSYSLKYQKKKRNSQNLDMPLKSVNNILHESMNNGLNTSLTYK